jgi:hypothetical protein
MAEESKRPPAGGEGPPPAEIRPPMQAQQQQQLQVPVDISGLSSLYTNFFRVVGTAEELIIDFGLHTQQMTTQGPEVIKLSNRVVMSYYTAKRLLQTLHLSVNRHESAFGVLETDPAKRLRVSQPGMRPGGSVAGGFGQ